MANYKPQINYQHVINDLLKEQKEKDMKVRKKQFKVILEKLKNGKIKPKSKK